MDTNMSFEKIFRKIVREENEALLNRVKELLSDKTSITIDSKPMVFDATCKYIPCSRSYLYKLTSKNLIPHSKRGKKLYFIKSELDAWLIENKVKTIDEIKEEVNMKIINIKK